VKEGIKARLIKKESGVPNRVSPHIAARNICCKSIGMTDEADHSKPCTNLADRERVDGLSRNGKTSSWGLVEGSTGSPSTGGPAKQRHRGQGHCPWGSGRKARRLKSVWWPVGAEGALDGGLLAKPQPKAERGIQESNVNVPQILLSTEIIHTLTARGLHTRF